MTFGLTYKGNIHDFLSDSAEIYGTVLFKENLNISNKQRGFSLVQVMVAIALMGGLALMMMKMMENQTKMDDGRNDGASGGEEGIDRGREKTRVR